MYGFASSEGVPMANSEVYLATNSHTQEKGCLCVMTAKVCA